jgi:hypothetical protein
MLVEIFLLTNLVKLRFYIYIYIYIYIYNMYLSVYLSTYFNSMLWFGLVAVCDLTAMIQLKKLGVYEQLYRNDMFYSELWIPYRIRFEHGRVGSTYTEMDRHDLC